VSGPFASSSERPEATGTATATEKVVARAGRNTALRAAGELIGKAASLALVFVLARKGGTAGLGVYIFALAWAEVVGTPIDMGFDRYVLRRVARDHAAADELFFNVLLTKVLRALPILAVSLTAVNLLHYGATTRESVYLASFGILLNSLIRTALGLFNAHERGGMVAVTIALQRILGAVGGLAALALGSDVVGVLAAVVVANAVAFAVALVLTARSIGLPQVRLSRAARRELRRESWPYAGQELLSVGITRVDTLLLSLIATTAVVGLYGAGYRLFEATLFVSVALTGAFSAMFTYLDADSDPPVGAVFQRALKLSLFLLVPVGTVFVVLAAPIIDLLFGGDFAAAAAPLRLLGPTAVLLGVVIIATSLVTSRVDPKRVLRAFAVALAVNVAANLVLIPWLDAVGAALAMLLTEVVFAIVVLRMATASVGRLSAAHTCVAPLAGGLLMAMAMWALDASLPLALAAGVVAYLAGFAAVEHVVAPSDLAFVTSAVRRKLPRRSG
jgi:O-antigen/teichoic acid export membrane protein